MFEAAGTTIFVCDALINLYKIWYCNTKPLSQCWKNVKKSLGRYFLLYPVESGPSKIPQKIGQDALAIW